MDGGNHCGALMKKVHLEPGGTVRLLYFLGEGGADSAREAREKYTSAVVDHEAERLHDFWEEKLSRLHVKTPNEGMNTEINTWNLYQSEINVMFSRFTSFIEVGGRVGLGYRDTAQDAMTIPHADEEGCRKRIVQLLKALTTTGYDDDEKRDAAVRFIEYMTSDEMVNKFASYSSTALKSGKSVKTESACCNGYAATDKLRRRACGTLLLTFPAGLRENN